MLRKQQELSNKATIMSSEADPSFRPRCSLDFCWFSLIQDIFKWLYQSGETPADALGIHTNENLVLDPIDVNNRLGARNDPLNPAPEIQV